jgi:hypothetical protein
MPYCAWEKDSPSRHPVRDPPYIALIFQKPDLPCQVYPQCPTKEETMADKAPQDVCPTCQGNKVIPGVCETSNEWQGDDDNQICTPDQPCPTCKGTGYVDQN